jgi:hypothetical protein
MQVVKVVQELEGKRWESRHVTTRIFCCTASICCLGRGRANYDNKLNSSSTCWPSAYIEKKLSKRSRYTASICYRGGRGRANYDNKLTPEIDPSRYQPHPPNPTGRVGLIQASEHERVFWFPVYLFWYNSRLLIGRLLRQH